MQQQYERHAQTIQNLFRIGFRNNLRTILFGIVQNQGRKSPKTQSRGILD